MKIYYTSDSHFSHASIIKYCNRPYLKDGDLLGKGDIAKRPWKSEEIKQKRADWMDEDLIKRWNNKVSPDDIVYHLGDFGFLNSTQYNKYLNKLNGHITVINGNHDYKNHVKSYINKCKMNIGGHTVLAMHHPPKHICTSSDVDFVICGHVHNKFKFKTVEGTIVINVGVDVWNYEPVSTESLLKHYHLYKNGIVDEMGDRI